MQPLLTSLAEAVTGKRALVLGGLALVVAAFASQIPRIRADFTPQDLFTSIDGQDQIMADFQASFGSTDNVLLLLVQADDVLALEPLQYLHDLSRFARAAPFTERAESITVSPIPRSARLNPNAETEPARPLTLPGGIPLPGVHFPDIGRPELDSIVDGELVTSDESAELRDALARSPLLQRRLVSIDFDLATVAVFLDPSLTRIQEFRTAVQSFRDWIAAHPPPDGVAVNIAGLPFVRTVVVERFRTDQTVIVPLAMLACMVILLFTIRWTPGVVLPLVAVGISAVIVVGGMGLVGEPINIINNIVPALIIIIGISNSIHLVARFREELRAGSDQLQATRYTVRSMAVACFLTSLTTAIGFASLLVSRTELLQRFGVTAAIGVMVSYVVTITFLPALFTLVKRPSRDTSGAVAGAIERGVAALTRAILAHPGVVLVGAAAVLAASIWVSVEGSVVDNSVFDQFDERDEIVQTTRLLERELEGVMPLEISLQSDDPTLFVSANFLNQIDDFTRWLRDREGVLSVSSYPEYLHEAWALLQGEPERRTSPFESDAFVGLLMRMIESAPKNPIAPFITADRAHARLGLRLADVGAQATIALGDEILAEAARRFAGEPVTVALTGDAYVNARGLDAVIDDLVGSLGLAVVIIFGFLALLFRSVRLGLLSVPPNVIPLLVTLAYMALRGIQLNTATAMIFSISIGLAVDATIHVMARFREEAQGRTHLDEALVGAARGAGRAIVITCVMLIVGFSVMLISSFVPVRRFGELIAVTAFGTLLGNLIVLPALLKVGFEKLGVRSPLFGPLAK